MAPQSSPDPTLFQRLTLQVKTLHFVWFIGHLCLVLCVLRYTSLWIRMKCYGGMAEFCYRTAFISAATTYGIAVYKILCFRAQTSHGYSALSIAAHEIFQYLALALIWLFMPQRPIALLPYCIYSIFHIAVYTRSDLIPTLKTPIPANLIRALQNNAVSRIQTEIETNVVTPFQTRLQANLNPELQAILSTAVAAAALDAEMVPTSDSIADKISVTSDSIADNICVFIKTHYDTSMSVLAQTIISIFVPQWIYPIFHLVTRLAALPIDTSGAKPHVVSTPDSIADNIGVFIKTYYDFSMSVVTGLEVFIWFSLLVSAITFQHRSWIMIVLYTVFLRARYDERDLAQLEAKVDGFLDAQNIPFTARWAWKSAMVLTRQFYHASDLKKYMCLMRNTYLILIRGRSRDPPRHPHNE